MKEKRTKTLAELLKTKESSKLPPSPLRTLIELNKEQKSRRSREKLLKHIEKVH
jgi:hypothetical protein